MQTGILRQLHEAILTILKKRFPNLTADEASKLTFDIVEAVESLIFPGK